MLLMIREFIFFLGKVKAFSLYHLEDIPLSRLETTPPQLARSAIFIPPIPNILPPLDATLYISRAYQTQIRRTLNKHTKAMAKN